MKKSVLAMIIAGTALISSLMTIAAMKIVKNISFGDPIIILSDKRCDNCNSEGLKSNLKKRFPDRSIEIIDYNDSDGQELYSAEKLGKLPAVLLPQDIKESKVFSSISRYCQKGNEFLHLKTGGTFDPKAEICSNKIDDDNNGLADCKDPACTKSWQCMEKRKKPDVDVFVMSHCPYGTQIMRGILPVMNLLDDKANINIRFCDYAMHGKKELDEQLRMYCIQKMDSKKFRTYIACFLEDGDSTRCVNKSMVSNAALQQCVAQNDRRFAVSRNFNNKKTWKGRFPSFAVDAALVKKYDVKGSPTLVINDTAAKAGRSPQKLLDAVCLAFNEVPEECNKKIDSSMPAPGFSNK